MGSFVLSWQETLWNAGPGDIQPDVSSYVPGQKQPFQVGLPGIGQSQMLWQIHQSFPPICLWTSTKLSLMTASDDFIILAICNWTLWVQLEYKLSYMNTSPFEEPIVLASSQWLLPLWSIWMKSEISTRKPIVWYRRGVWKPAPWNLLWNWYDSTFCAASMIVSVSHCPELMIVKSVFFKVISLLLIL